MIFEEGKNEPTLKKSRGWSSSPEPTIKVPVFPTQSRGSRLCFPKAPEAGKLHSRPDRLEEDIWEHDSHVSVDRKKRHYYSAHMQGFRFAHNPVLLHVCVHSALASVIFESKTFSLCESVTTVWPHTWENRLEGRREFSSLQIQRLPSLRVRRAWWKRTAPPAVTRMKRDGLAGFYPHVLPRSYPMGLGCPHPAWVFIPWLTFSGTTS